MAKILIVDDDEQITNLFEKFLTMEGYEAIGLNDSTRAVDLANLINPDLFLLDLMMPQPDGFKLCRMLRADPKFKHTPIIIITALGDSDTEWWPLALAQTTTSRRHSTLKNSQKE